MNFFIRFRKLNTFFIFLCLTISACGGNGGGNNVNALGLPTDPSYVRLDLTDTSSANVKSIFVNVLTVELFVQVDGKPNIVVLASNIGLVNLLNLQNGVFEKLGQLQLPPNSSISQIRFILGSGNNVIMTDGTVCQLTTPSAQQSAIMIPLNSNLITQADQSYDLALDFQSDLSVVIQNSGQNNASCQLTPKVAVIWATQVSVMPPTSAAATGVAPNFPPGGPTAAGTITATSLSGSSGGTFSENSDPTDPATVTSTNLWSE